MKPIAIGMFVIGIVISFIKADEVAQDNTTDPAEIIKTPMGRKIDTQHAPALKYESTSDAESWRFSYETEDGQKRKENGHVENKGEDDEKATIKGSYSFIGSDGIEYIVKYIADNNGFRPYVNVKRPNAQ